MERDGFCLADAVVAAGTGAIAIDPNRLWLVTDCFQIDPRKLAHLSPALRSIDDVIFGLMVMWVRIQHLNIDYVEKLWTRVVLIFVLRKRHLGSRSRTHGSNPGAVLPVSEDFPSGDAASTNLKRIGQAHNTFEVRHLSGIGKSIVAV